ncbi:Uncharacterised protein [Mycobacterium tuberculosis]|nr:Uncharacterised protein [Mycobacterium tuberculosis]
MPALGGEVVEDVVAWAGVDQRSQVDVHAMTAERVGYGPRSFGAEIRYTGNKFGGYHAPGRAECGDVVEQPVLSLRLKIYQ